MGQPVPISQRSTDKTFNWMEWRASELERLRRIIQLKTDELATSELMLLEQDRSRRRWRDAFFALLAFCVIAGIQRWL